MLPIMYPDVEGLDNPLLELVERHITFQDAIAKGTTTTQAAKRRTAFFENNVADYSKGNFVDDL